MGSEPASSTCIIVDLGFTLYRAPMRGGSYRLTINVDTFIPNIIVTCKQSAPAYDGLIAKGKYLLGYCDGRTVR